MRAHMCLAAWLHRRDRAAFQKWAALSHNKTGLVDLNKESTNAEIFGSNTSCVLTPDNANGPYFVNQEHIRSDIVENTPGVPMHIELQFIDVNTCKPATQLLIDTWSCNATGAYSGVSAAGEGGLGTTYLRGVQPTDADGVVVSTLALLNTSSSQYGGGSGCFVLLSLSRYQSPFPNCECS